MGKTPIEWARWQPDDEPGHSINPIRFRNKETGKVGHFCVKISPGCKFCYSSTMQTGPYLSGLEFLAENRDRGELFLDRNALDQVLRRRKPTVYFWCDMTDLFGNWVPFEWIDAIIATMVATPQHRHMILTKRDRRALEYFTSGRQDNGHGPDRATVHLDDEDELPAHLRLPGTKRLDIWIGVSVEDRERKSRLDTLREIPATHRFASFEPLLEDLALNSWDMEKVDLSIFGGESGSQARDCYAEWIRRGTAVAKRAGSLVFVKQVGRRPVDRNDAGFDGDTVRSWPAGTTFRELDTGYQGAPVLIKIKDAKGGDMLEWPPALRVRELPQ